MLRASALSPPWLLRVFSRAGDTLGGVHETLVFIMIALVVLHVAAALKHQFVDRA